MYVEYWGLKEKPFENTPEPRFLYHSSLHEEAFSRMLYAIRERKGGAMLSGEYGSGKTLLSRALMQELSEERYQVALIFNPRLKPMEFIREIIYQLGGDSASISKSKLLHILNEILYNNHNKNKDTILLIDEAQAIESLEIFEEIRLLLNFQLNNAFLLTMILLGQPELREKVMMIPQLDQRLAIRYHLYGLDEKETKNYIDHRLGIAGLTKEKTIFTDGAVKLIYESSLGIPRKINNLCDMCLLIGFGTKANKIDEAITREVVKDLEANPTRKVAKEVGAGING
jgi:general secretion pathway protein A